MRVCPSRTVACQQFSCQPGRNASLVPYVDAGECRRVRSHGCQGGSHGTATRASWQIEGRTSVVMRNRTTWARITALAASLAIIMAGMAAGSAFAQDESSVALEQARSGE